MKLSYLVALPEWFNPWGWVGIGAIIVILLIILVALIVKSRKGGKEEAEDEEPEETAEAEPAVEEEPAEPEEEPVAEEDGAAEESTTAEPAADKDAKAAKPAVKTYHIAKRKEDNRWQVKAAGGARAIKLFFTQAEAIEYAKKLAESQEARIVIHKEDGTFRRLNYKK